MLLIFAFQAFVCRTTKEKKSNISQAITDKSRSLTNAKSGIFGRCVYVLTEFLSNATA